MRKQEQEKTETGKIMLLQCLPFRLEIEKFLRFVFFLITENKFIFTTLSQSTMQLSHSTQLMGTMGQNQCIQKTNGLNLCYKL
jgi:hypothetical protein